MSGLGAMGVGYRRAACWFGLVVATMLVIAAATEIFALELPIWLLTAMLVLIGAAACLIGRGIRFMWSGH